MTTLFKLINLDDLAIKAHELVNNEIVNGGDYETYLMVIYDNLIWEVWSAVEVPNEKAFYTGRVLQALYKNATNNSRSIEQKTIHTLSRKWNKKLERDFPELKDVYDLEKAIYR